MSAPKNNFTSNGCVSSSVRLLIIGVSALSCGILFFIIGVQTPLESGMPAYKEILNWKISDSIAFALLFLFGVGMGIWVSVNNSKKITQQLFPHEQLMPAMITKDGLPQIQYENANKSQNVRQAQRIGDYSFVYDRRGCIVGFWIKDPGIVNDRDRLSFLILAALMKKGVPDNEIEIINVGIMSGTFRTVENHFDNNGGLFVMLPGGKAPGEV